MGTSELLPGIHVSSSVPCGSIPTYLGRSYLIERVPNTSMTLVALSGSCLHGNNTGCARQPIRFQCLSCVCESSEKFRSSHNICPDSSSSEHVSRLHLTVTISPCLSLAGVPLFPFSQDTPLIINCLHSNRYFQFDFSLIVTDNCFFYHNLLLFTIISLQSKMHKLGQFGCQSLRSWSLLLATVECP